MFISNQSSRLLKRIASGQLASTTVLAQRGLKKAVPKCIRTKIPRFKKDLRDLPPLTELLVKPIENIGLNEARNLRLKKLAVYREYLPVGSTDSYIEEILSEDNVDVDNVLKLIEKYLPTLTSFHVAISFEALNDLVQSKLGDPMTIVVAPEFKQLCKKAIYKLRFFESDEVLKLLQCLSNLNIPEDTLLVQGALQMARHHINDYNYDELVCLNTTLERFVEKIDASKSLLVALKKITPRALERQIKEKLYTPTLLELLEQAEPEKKG